MCLNRIVYIFAYVKLIFHESKENMKHGYMRVASCVPAVSVADCAANVTGIISMMEELEQDNVSLAVFPEMCITAYTCADLFHNRTLLDGAYESLGRLLDASKHKFSGVVIVGMPIEAGGALYNCACAVCNGRILAVAPKTYIPNYNEFYELRWWQPAPKEPVSTTLLGQDLMLDAHQLIEIEGVKVGVEICEDLWTPVPPSCELALQGAQVIVNLSASDDLIGKYHYLKSLLSQQSARCLCAYLYASAGYGESSTDLVFDGKAMIYENGKELAANQRWQSGSQHVVADIDIEAIDRDRMHIGSFAACAARHSMDTTVVRAHTHQTSDIEPAPLMRYIDPMPFVPATDSDMHDRCSEIINIQVAGLAKRLDFIHARTLVVGISGGLDSTLALLVAVKTFDRLGLDRKCLIGITMPGYGTSPRTKGNAWSLMQQLGISIREIPIVDAVAQHFADIGHDPSKQDVTYENSQARERTQILMDVANQVGGIVLGTGDLSELALGWATFNGDHMSMYGVNAGIPKTLVRHLVRHFAYEPEMSAARDTLIDIIDTPISPELIPADRQGNIIQKTEDLVGPYELHDFFLYHMLRYGFAPDKVYFMAKTAFGSEYDSATILKWMREFYRRFFQQQFKRSCLPDGPKVGSVCVSPRGDWRMPSDASARMWLAQIDAMKD